MSARFPLYFYASSFFSYNLYVSLVVANNALLAIVFKIRIADIDKSNAMSGENYFAPFIIKSTLLTSAYPTDGLFSVKESYGFCVLAFAILYDKT